MRAKYSSYIPVDLSVKQLAFLAAPFREKLYGGQAGGGKSIALLAAALLFVDIPGYNALLLRKTFADLALPDAIMDISHQWLAKTGAHWSEKLKRWYFPEGGTLSFGYMEHARDKYRYQGAQFQFVGFDELTQFEPDPYLYLFSRLRKSHLIKVPLRFMSATNPGGIGHDWVFERFIEAPGLNRLFVPAGIADNPHIDRLEYEKSLAELDETTKAQLLEGRWISSDDVTRFLNNIILWDRCRDEALPELSPREPMVIALDAGVSDDHFSLIGVTRHPYRPEEAAVRVSMDWAPPAGGKLDFMGTEDDPGPERVVRWLADHYNVTQLAYDPYQLHYMATRLENDGIWTSEFDQNRERLRADKMLYDMIVQRRIWHDGSHELLRDHLANANKQFYRLENSYRLIKRTARQKIDMAVATSMATSRAMELNLA